VAIYGKKKPGETDFALPGVSTMLLQYVYWKQDGLLGAIHPGPQG